jgi:multidrug efflux pump subunit AcrA (membrane-fusion protein)
MSCKFLYSILFAASLAVFSACKGADTTLGEPAGKVQAPVEVVHVSHEAMSDYIELNATAIFLLKHFVKANANGYLSMHDLHPGQAVSKGQVLFSVRTKESVSLGNSLNVLDSTFKFSGINNIKASDNGFITQLDHQSGDYVQDGETLAAISNAGSFVFVMNMPYAYRSSIHIAQQVKVILPDSETLDGTVASMMPTVDSLAQTQNVVIKVKSSHIIPENLIARVRIEKTSKAAVISLPKAAVLTDETQSGYWIMKMQGNGLAVKIPVQKGMEANGNIEILSPLLNDNDMIVVTGNYGLDDSARVKIIKVVK